MSLIETLETAIAVSAPISAFGGVMWRHFTDKLDALERKIRERDEIIAQLRVELGGVVRTNKLALPLWTQDAAGRMLWASPRAMLVIFAPMGLTGEDVLGKTFLEIFGEEVSRESDLLDKRAANQIDSTQFSIINFAPGVLHPMFVTKTVTIDEDGQIIKQGAAFRLNELARGGGDFANAMQRMISRANLRERDEAGGADGE